MVQMTYKNVYAAYPAYREGMGNGIEYITKDGTFWVDQCFATFKKHWAEDYGRVWEQVIKESEEILEKKHLHVVLLSEENCLIPMKTRIPICKDDGAYGYLWAEKIQSLKVIKGGTKIIMEGGGKVFAYTKIETIKKYRMMARYLKSEHVGKGEKKQKIKEIIIYE